GNWEAIAHGLSEASQVRYHPEEFLRAAQTKVKAAADFVEDQQSAVVVGKILHALQESGSGFLKIERLHDHGTKLTVVGCKHGFQRGKVVIAEGMRQAPHGSGNSEMAGGAADIPILPAVISAARDPLAASVRARGADCARGHVRAVFPEPHHLGA